MKKSGKKILTIFGTRPEIIKLAPIIKELETHADAFQTVNVSSGQHTDLLHPFVSLFEIRLDHDLQVMERDQTPSQVCSRVLTSFDPVLVQEKPDFVLVQGDTTTALASALAAFHRRIPVGHVEAGLRSGDVYSPYPEEMNRKLISRLTSYHFAATLRSRANLLLEGVDHERVFVTGNPVVDSLKTILERPLMAPVLVDLLKATQGSKRVILTTHRRESFGNLMSENLRVLGSFVERNQDVTLIFPVHPNPSVIGPATTILSSHPRIYLTRPLNYEDFVALLSHSWLIVSDSGGIQEEAPTLGKPLLILRENTERPEALEAGVARLVGGRPEKLSAMLDEILQDGNWAEKVREVPNPFGDGNSGKRIVKIINDLLRPETQTAAESSLLDLGLAPTQRSIL